MRKIFILFISFFAIFNIITSRDDTLLNTIIEKTKLNEKDKLILIFTTVSDCHKCINIPMSIVQSIDETKIKLVKFLAVISCDRDLELLCFKNLFHWEYPMIRDDGHFKQNMGLDKKTIFAIIDIKG